MLNNILITGGAGFIGSTLADNLLADGYKVICADNFSDYYSPEIKRNNISKAVLNPNYKLYEINIEDADALDDVFRQNQIDLIIHLAARAGVRPSIEQPLEYMKTNVIGTMNILEVMKKYNVKKMCMASSSSVYGNCKEDKFSENLNVREPISPYAASKSACEQICYTYSHLYNMQILMLRFFTVYGPRQRPDLAINKFVRKIKANEPIEMYGDGSTMRDYTYIEDIVDGIKKAMNYTQNSYDIFNLGGGSPITLKQMIETIENELGIKAEIRQLPMQPGDVLKTVSDISKATSKLGYLPKTSFQEGIKKFIEWSQK